MTITTALMRARQEGGAGGSERFRRTKRITELEGQNAHREEVAHSRPMSTRRPGFGQGAPRKGDARARPMGRRRPELGQGSPRKGGVRARPMGRRQPELGQDAHPSRRVPRCPTTTMGPASGRHPTPQAI
jgi:hypothetical protein